MRTTRRKPDSPAAPQKPRDEISDYRALYDLGPVIWMALDETGVILDINLAGSSAFGMPSQFIRGTPLRMWLAEQSRTRLLEHLRTCRATDETIETDMSLKTTNGTPQPLVRLYSRRQQFRDRVLMPTVIVDVTEREQLVRERQRAEQQRDAAQRERAEARAAEAAKDRLIAFVSHELRNPLSPALLAASVLAQRHDLPVDARDLAGTIQRNIEIEARLIDDLLDLARATQGRLTLRRTKTDVHDVLSRAVSSCAAHTCARRIDVRMSLLAEQHHADADADRLQQVFWNLLTNAIKFSETGAHVTVRTTSDVDGIMRILVRDQGVGMDDATLGALFHPFEQPRAPVSGRAGLGLGLTIARGIIDLHGGQIWATSAGPNQGSMFEVELPVVPPDAVAVSAPTERAPYAEPVSRGRALIVEDHHDTADLMATALSTNGYDVTVARTLRDGLTALSRGAAFDLVLSDIGLGDGSGLDIARCAARLAQRPRHVMALSGYGSPADIEASRAAGFDMHFVKPLNLRELLRQVDQRSAADTTAVSKAAVE